MKALINKYPLSFLLFFLVINLSSCSEKPQGPGQFPHTEVTSWLVEPYTIPANVEFIGVAQSSHLVEIRARVEGYLEDIAYSEGEYVHEGEVLFHLDPKPFQAALSRAEGDLARQEAILWNAKRSSERLKPLFEKNAASRRDLDNAIAEELAAEASVKSAKAQVEQARLNLSYTSITSPVSGVASQSNYRRGALISPGAGGLLTTVSIIDPIWINFNISERDILKEREEISHQELKYPQDMNFEVEVELANGKVFESRGKVDFTDPSFKQSTGTLNIRAVIPNPQHLLRPGQFVRVRMIGSVRPDAIAIPQRAVLQGSKGMFVYVIGADKKVIRRDIEVGDWYQNLWIIKSGLTAGEEVVIDGVNKVQPGFPVNVTKQEKNSEFSASSTQQ